MFKIKLFRYTSFNIREIMLLSLYLYFYDIYLLQKPLNSIIDMLAKAKNLAFI